MQVLRKLGHISADDVVLLKGRAACEIDTADELLTTELMFNGTFNNLDKHQLVALVSCLVPVEKSNVSIGISAYYLLGATCCCPLTRSVGSLPGFTFVV